MGNHIAQVRHQIFAGDPSPNSAVSQVSQHRKSTLFGVVITPHIFTTFRSFSFEWNLCGKLDPARTVDVVGDAKLHRKKQKYLFVDKCTQLRLKSETRRLAKNELEIMLYLSMYSTTQVGALHPNLVALKGYFSFRNQVHVITEFCEMGNLIIAYIKQTAEKGKPPPAEPPLVLHTEADVCDAMLQICSGLQFLHSNGVVHGDLALNNIFVTSDMEYKIGDFERAVFVGPENIPQQLREPEPFRRVYGAPELYMASSGCGNNNDGNRFVDLQKADMWGLGIVFLMLLTKRPLFDAAEESDKGYQLFRRVGLQRYLKAMYLEQSAICPLTDDMVALAQGLLTVDPVKRFSIQDALQSKWFTNRDANSQ